MLQYLGEGVSTLEEVVTGGEYWQGDSGVSSENEFDRMYIRGGILFTFDSFFWQLSHETVEMH